MGLFVSQKNFFKYNVDCSPEFFAMKLQLNNYSPRTSLRMIRRRRWRRPGLTLRSRSGEDIRSKLWPSRTRPAPPLNRIRRRRRRKMLFPKRKRGRKMFLRSGRVRVARRRRPLLLPMSENRGGTARCSKRRCPSRFRRRDCQIDWTARNKFKGGRARAVQRCERGRQIHCWWKFLVLTHSPSLLSKLSAKKERNIRK